MIPSTSGFLQQEPEMLCEPTHTYKMNGETERVQGCAEELDAMKQAVYKILLTERFQYLIYSGNYGIETLDLYGQPVSYVCPELERRITEALTCDDRIESVGDFEFDLSEKDKLRIYFTVHTIFGEVKGEKELEI